jgi:hypothetical protein
MSSKRREYHVDRHAKKAALFFLACDANPGTRVNIPDSMRIKGYSISEAADRSLQQQVRREAGKNSRRGCSWPFCSCGCCVRVCADYPVDYGKRGEAGSSNDHCSGGCLRLAGSRGGRSSIATQEDAKNVASGADHAAES